jgi:hypothetical protein
MNYPKMIEIYNSLVSENINDNLMHCARYRGVAFMPLRTLREFQWFCDAILYQEYLKNDFRDLWSLNVTWWKYFYECHPHLNSDMYLIEASKLFLKYCIVCYHDLELEP